MVHPAVDQARGCIAACVGDGDLEAPRQEDCRRRTCATTRPHPLCHVARRKGLRPRETQQSLTVDDGRGFDTDVSTRIGVCFKCTNSRWCRCRSDPNPAPQPKRCTTSANKSMRRNPRVGVDDKPGGTSSTAGKRDPMFSPRRASSTSMGKHSHRSQTFALVAAPARQEHRRRPLRSPGASVRGRATTASSDPRPIC